MNKSVRAAATGALAASILLALAACQKVDPDAPRGKAAGTPAAQEIAGLPTEQEQSGYAIGLQIGGTLAEIKDEVNVDALIRAMRTSLEGGEPLMTEDQARQAFESLGQRMQAKMAEGNRAEGTAFLEANAAEEGVQVTASGLQYKVIQQGEGPTPDVDSRVQVHYRGTLVDGTVFDSSYDRGEPAVFTLSGVVPGWQEGLQMMSVGSKYMLWLPSELGYGDMGTPGGPIAPGSVLVFEVELLDILDDAAE